MDYYSLEVVCLYKHFIVHKKVEKKRISINMVIVIAFFCLSALGFLTSFVAKDYYSTLSSTISVIYNNPVDPLYNDAGNIIFTGLLKSNKYNVSKDVELKLPVLSTKTTVGENFISFEIDKSIMVTAACDGVVEDLGVNSDGHKFVKIKHSKNITTLYNNIDVAGVVVGDEVKAGADIATAKVGHTVTFVVLNDGVAVTNLSINQNKIMWQN